jgi:HEAT repeat protein
MLEILAARNAKEAVPAIVSAASDPETTIRLAALDALRTLADEGQTGDLVKLLQTAETGVHRSKAEAALLSLCGRGREKCVPALAAALADADALNRQTLLQALARAGGSAALESVASCLEDPDQAVRDEAVRMLSLWPDRAVVPRLQKIATADNLRHHVLAVRGLVRLASPEGEQPADLRLLGDTIRSARRRDEKQLALGVLGRTASLDSLALAVALLDDPAIAEDAGWTAGAIAESLPAENREAVRAALQRVLERCQGPKARGQAQKVLESRS